MTSTPSTKPAAKMNRKELCEYLKAADAYEGHSRDSADDLRDIVANLQADATAEVVDEAPGVHPGHRVPAGPDLLELARTKKIARQAAEATPEPEVAEAHPDPKERVKLAKAEHKLLQQWISDGEHPPRPATPNLDAVNAEYAAGVTAKERRRAAKATTSTRTRASRVELGTLPEGAEVGTCRACNTELPATRFPKAVVNGKRQPNLRADECRSCRQARRAG